MTGFGKGVASCTSGEFAIELRSVNHRQIEIRVNAPRELSSATGRIEQTIRSRFSRGRFDAHVRFEVSSSRSVFSMARAKEAYAALLGLRDELAPGEALPFTTLLSMPQLFVAELNTEDNALKDAFERALGAAVFSLDETRTSEGAALASEFTARLSSMRETIKKLDVMLPRALSDHHQRMSMCIQGWLSGREFADPARLAQELAIASERADTTEEVARLVAHIAAAEVATTTEGPCGRRLDFLLQEMSREANTLGAKSLTAEISHLSIELRAEIERMREQAQNIE